MTPASSMVFVVDDDQSVREALSGLIRSVGLNVETYASAHEYLRRQPQQSPACLVLDVRMPGLSGLDLQRELANQGREIPIIFVTAHGDIPMTVKAMKAGAADWRYATLTQREKEVVMMVVRGLPNKQVAAKLNVSENTVKVHRRHIMVKMEAKSLPQLVRITEALRLK